MTAHPEVTAAHQEAAARVLDYYTDQPLAERIALAVAYAELRGERRAREGAEAWVAVSERLPADREPVLFAADAVYCGSIHFKICPCGGPNCDAELNPPEWRLEEDQELVLGVTHWMPLPSPPQWTQGPAR